MDIRQATLADLDAMWEVFRSAMTAEDAFPFSSGFTRDTFRTHWFTSQVAHVAVMDERIVGIYKLGPNYPDLGAHVATATYAVHSTVQGKGIGHALVRHSLATAKSSGFMSMQFNFVVSTNLRALHLYEKLGFAAVGTLPKAFKHRKLGLVDAHVMYRFLQPQDDVSESTPRPISDRSTGPVARFLGACAALLAASMLSFILTFMLDPLWTWIESTSGIESIGHSGPAGWCFVATFIAIMAFLVGANVFIGRKGRPAH